MSTYGWAKRGVSGRIKRNIQQFRICFVMVHSSGKVEGIIGTADNLNTLKY